MSSDTRRRRVLLVAFIATSVVTTLVLASVIRTVFLAITVAYILYPIRQWAVTRGHSRRIGAVAATLVGFFAVLAVVLPIFGALYVRRLSFIGFVQGLPSQIPVSVFGFEHVIEVQMAISLVQDAVTAIAVDIAQASPVISLKAALFVFLVYALLLRPHDIRAALMELVPRAYEPVVMAFHERIRSTLYAIYVLQAATAFGTFLIAYVLFAVLGYDSSLVLAVLAGLLQFIPVIGPSLVIVVLAIYQLALGNTGAAILVTSLGLVLVGFLPDALIRPRLASMTADMPGSLYFVGFVGGVLTVGVVGFIAGPLAVALLIEAGEQLSDEIGVTPAETD